ncbi:MAG: hypothetical protein AAF355_11455 [Myxococcota bacterium]
MSDWLAWNALSRAEETHQPVIVGVTTADLSHMLATALKIFEPSGTTPLVPPHDFSRKTTRYKVAFGLWNAVCNALEPQLESFLQLRPDNGGNDALVETVSIRAPLHLLPGQYRVYPRWLVWGSCSIILLVCALALINIVLTLSKATSHSSSGELSHQTALILLDGLGFYAAVVAWNLRSNKINPKNRSQIVMLPQHDQFGPDAV